MSRQRRMVRYLFQASKMRRESAELQERLRELELWLEKAGRAGTASAHDDGRHIVVVVDETVTVGVDNAVREKPAPPRIADLILEWVVSPDKRDAFLGDRRERFESNAEKYGLKDARRLYWVDTWWSAWPLLRNLLVRLAFIASIVRKILG